MEAIINKITSAHWKLLLGFFLLSFLVYLPGIEGRFTSDFYNWVHVYETSPLSSLWTCFDYPGLHQLYHIPFYLTYKLFGLSEIGWHFVFTSLHAINAFLIYKVAKKILALVTLDNKWALLTSLLFLLSPFQTETVAWGATIHYLLMVTFLMSSFLQLINYLERKEKQNLLLFYLFYVLGLFTMELPLVFPAVFVSYSLLTQKVYNIEIKEAILKLTLPFLIIFLLYFSLSKLIFGAFIGHYGAERHLQFDVLSMLDTLYAYLMKFVFFYRYIPMVEFKNIIIKVFSNSVFQGLTLLILIAFVGWKTIIKPELILSKLALSMIFILSFCISLIPVLNIEMSSNMFLQTDRYSYLASVFFYLGSTVLLSSIRGNLRSIFIISFIALNSILLLKDVFIWRDTGIIANKMIDSYKFQNEETYTLNLIDNYNGAYLFRNGFEAAMYLEKGVDIHGKFNHLLSINSTELNDSITYSMHGDTLNLAAVKWGRWFWRHGRGATNFEDDNFKFVNGYMGVESQLILKSNSDKIFIYLKGGEWKRAIIK